MPTYYADVRLNRKLTHVLFPSCGTFTLILISLRFVFQLLIEDRRRRTDGRTGKTRIAAYQDGRAMIAYRRPIVRCCVASEQYGVSGAGYLPGDVT